MASRHLGQQLKYFQRNLPSVANRTSRSFPSKTLLDIHKIFTVHILSTLDYIPPPQTSPVEHPGGLVKMFTYNIFSKGDPSLIFSLLFVLSLRHTRKIFAYKILTGKQSPPFSSLFCTKNKGIKVRYHHSYNCSA